MASTTGLQRRLRQRKIRATGRALQSGARLLSIQRETLGDRTHVLLSCTKQRADQ